MNQELPTLAVIGRVVDIQSIPEADRIESTTVVCGHSGKWMGVTVKGQFNVGDKCEVYLMDALLPQTPEFEFMSKYQYRVKMQRLRGCPSECLILPLTISGEVGQDITKEKNVNKYYKPLPGTMDGESTGLFPNFIPKTDEINFQAVPHLVEYMKGKQFYSTYKVDGSSATIYYYKKGSEDFFGCCSKNLEKREDDRNEIWKIAYKYDLKNIFNKLGKDLAIQFEVAGIGNKNKVGLSEVSPFLFNIYDISERRYLGVDDVIKFSKDYNFPMAWIQDYDKTFDFKNDEELRRYAEGHYPTGKTREGVVIRPMVETSIRGQRVSFKVINLLYKFN